VPAHGDDGSHETSTLGRRQLECARQPLGGIAIRVARASLEFLDTVNAQASSLGEYRLSPAGLGPIVSEQISERFVRVRRHDDYPSLSCARRQGYHARP
jgi:hypothetical protein